MTRADPKTIQAVDELRVILPALVSAPTNQPSLDRNGFRRLCHNAEKLQS